MSVFASDTSTDSQIFTDFLNLSTISFFNRGGFGIGFRVKINDSSKSKYNVLSLNNTEDTIKCSQLFLKLSPILDDDDDLYDYDDDGLDIWPSASKGFLKEIQIQTEAYKKTNNNLEALCPPIVYSKIFNNTHDSSSAGSPAQEFLSTMISQIPNESDSDLLQKMILSLKSTPNMKIGVIAMSFAENYNTLDDVISPLTDQDQINWYKYLASYELLRLYDIGFMHGDYHMENILINTNYRYNNLRGIWKGRCMLIDFGMAFKHEFKTTITPYEKLFHIAGDKINPAVPSQYSWLMDFIYGEGKDNINDRLDWIPTNQSQFQNRMISKLEEKYSGMIGRIRSNNQSSYKGSILKGGRALVENNQKSKIEKVVEPIEKENTMVKQVYKLNTKIDESTISDKEFKQIFNPSNMNMYEVMVKYENTINEGVLILNSEDKKGGKKKKSKRKTRKMKKSRKTKKSKRKTRSKKQRGGMYRNRSRPITYIACGVMYNDEGKILMGKRKANNPNYPSKWEFPGGKKEHGETIFECLEREWKEEMNLFIDISLRPLASMECGRNKICHFLVGRILDEYELELKEVAEVKYLTENEILELDDELLLDKNDKLVIRKLINEGGVNSIL